MPLFTICLRSKQGSNRVDLCPVEGEVVSFPDIPESLPYTWFIHHTTWLTKEGVQVTEDEWNISEKSNGRCIFLSGKDTMEDAIADAGKALKRKRADLSYWVQRGRKEYSTYSNAKEILDALDREVVDALSREA